MSEKPRIGSAPGLAWRKLGDGTWEGIWRARPDLIERGFRPKNHSLWRGTEPTLKDVAFISDTCRRLQDEMLIFSRGGLPKVSGFNGTLKSLIACYQTDPDSTYHKKRYHVRKNHDFTLKRIAEAHGTTELRDINARLLLSWHKQWTGGGVKIAMGHAFVGHLRTLLGFGFTLLEDAECERLSAVMHKMRFPAGKARTERLTAEQADMIRAAARDKGWHSIALAQAFQFEFMLRQKDCVGEWVPISEPGASDVFHKNLKWLRGLRWSEIDGNLMLKHTTSKRDKELVVDLKLAPMVLQELDFIGERPTSGPIVICEHTKRPWLAAEFRRKWRILADECGIPKSVKNMDSRSGAISEATDAGADLEHVRHAATHSDIAMTQRYSRGSEDKIANVQRARVIERNKPKT